jgi:hypothetical protein
MIVCQVLRVVRVDALRVDLISISSHTAPGMGPEATLISSRLASTELGRSAMLLTCFETRDNCTKQGTTSDPIGVQLWIVDSHLQPHSTAGTHCQSNDLREFSNAQTARHSVVHCWHDSVVEHVSVAVNPETPQIVCEYGRNGLLGGRQDSERPKSREIDDMHRGFSNVTTAVARSFLGVAVTHHRDIFVSDERAEPFKVREHRWTTTRGEREFHIRHRSSRRGLRLIEVGMTTTLIPTVWQ